VAACLLLAGCRCIAGYELADEAPPAVDARHDGGEDQRARDGTVDQRASLDAITDGDGAALETGADRDGRVDGAAEAGPVFDLQPDLQPDGRPLDSVPYPDLGGCPCAGGCPPLGECNIPCTVGKPRVCPPGYTCRFACASPVAFSGDCRWAKRCIVGCAFGGACLSVRCGGDCEVICSVAGACGGMKFFGGSGTNTLYCSGPGSCAKAEIIGGSGHTRVVCSGNQSCNVAKIDLSPSCGGRIECLGNCFGANTTCPPGCATCLSSNCACP
jgi:hypothetical protein